MPTPTYNATDRFGFLIVFLCELVAIVGPRRGLLPSVIVLIRARLWRLGVRFANLAGQIRAGTLAAPAPGRSTAPRREAAGRAPDMLPCERGWLLRWIPEADPSAVDQMEWMLKLPDMRNLIAATPRMGRIMRSLCRMLGVSLPAALRLRRQPTTGDAPPAAPVAPPPWREPGLAWLSQADFEPYRPPKKPA